MKKVIYTVLAFVLSLTFTSNVFAASCADFTSQLTTLQGLTSTPEQTQLDAIQFKYNGLIASQQTTTSQALAYYDAHYPQPAPTNKYNPTCEGQGAYCNQALNAWTASRNKIVSDGSTSVTDLQSSENAETLSVRENFNDLVTVQSEVNSCQVVPPTQIGGSVPTQPITVEPTKNLPPVTITKTKDPIAKTNTYVITQPTVTPSENSVIINSPTVAQVTATPVKENVWVVIIHFFKNLF